ncbi:putative membrane protein [Wickerhamomyces ciferrii]|uniref:Membrane protein n=1 Tax=Wickerhamomyces ciferrii (strain ATCC 14091 / BCRC 22168 / CBS 111 / JCM 3599 / NBRC 0793 / NRRL Y-1031 F-60-10) TaxID=1206466 RepID=K0KG93_WICCF|nr:uncharacterized protein BN7_1520 [Wickerhamomyces ciferrii]CCH41981.1 putative membrane protein [Wickerhamomyces ciferrii]
MTAQASRIMISKVKSAYESTIQKYQDFKIVVSNQLLSISLPDFTQLKQNIKSRFSRESIGPWGVFKLQDFWATSHLITIFGTLIYLYALISNSQTLYHTSYRISMIGTIITYTIVLFRSNISVTEEEVSSNDDNTSRVELIIEPTRVSLSDLLKDENALLLGYALLWLFTPPSIIKILPFNLYSYLNLTTFITTEILPNTKFSEVFTPCLEYIEQPVLIFASHLDVLIYVIVLRDSLSSKDAYALFIFGFIWILRFESLKASRSSVRSILNSFDYLLSFEPVYLYKIWKRLRLIVECFVQLKDEESLDHQSNDNDEDAASSRSEDTEVEVPDTLQVQAPSAQKKEN